MNEGSRKILEEIDCVGTNGDWEGGWGEGMLRVILIISDETEMEVGGETMQEETTRSRMPLFYRVGDIEVTDRFLQFREE